VMSCRSWSSHVSALGRCSLDHQVQLETVEPAHTALAAGGRLSKDAVAVDAAVVADG
jgi:hypothetical protein